MDSLATNPDAAETNDVGNVVAEEEEKTLNIPVPSAYCTVKAVALLSTETKDGLS